MAITIAAGMPTYSGGVIPELWTADTLVKLYEATVITKIASLNYQNELKKKGDVAHIRLEPTVLMKEYSVGMDMIAESDTMSTVDLTIDKAYYGAQSVPFVTAQQSDLDLLNIFQDALVKAAAVKVDAIALSTIGTGAASANEGATAGVKSVGYDLGATGASIPITSLNALDKLMDLVATLREQNADTDLWTVIPYWFARKLKTSDLMSAQDMGDGTSVVRSGLIGKIDNVEIYESNNLTSVTDGTDSNTCWYAHAGHKSALAFAQTIQEVIVEKIPLQASTAVEIIVAFGTVVANPNYLATLYCRPAA